MCAVSIGIIIRVSCRPTERGWPRKREKLIAVLGWRSMAIVGVGVWSRALGVLFGLQASSITRFAVGCGLTLIDVFEVWAAGDLWLLV